MTAIAESLRPAPQPAATDAIHGVAASMAALRRNDVARGLPLLFEHLAQIRAGLSREAWKRWIEEEFRTPENTELLFRDPITRRAAEKPRGYAGDAELLDLIYAGPPRSPSHLGPFDRRLGAAVLDAPAARAVRGRRVLLADEIDRAAASSSGARVFSLACGHLRELELSSAVQERAVTVVGADQDLVSLSELQRSYGHLQVEALACSVRDVLRRGVPGGAYELVYSAGLYDYLDTAVAQRLTRRLFDAVLPGGQLLLANFATTNADVGYMEAAMDWHLIHRDENDMRALLAELPTGQIAATSLSQDTTMTVWYLRLWKR